MSPDTFEADLRASLKASRVPGHYHEGLVRYLVHRIPTGSFLATVLRNNLVGAVVLADPAGADPAGARHLVDIVRWLFEHAPHAAWGSEEAVDRWTARRAVA